MTKLEKMRWFSTEIGKLKDYFEEQICSYNQSDKEDDEMLKKYSIDLSSMVQQYDCHDKERQKVASALILIREAFYKSDIDIKIEELKHKREEMKQKIEELEKLREEELKNDICN